MMLSFFKRKAGVLLTSGIQRLLVLGRIAESGGRIVGTIWLANGLPIGWLDVYRICDELAKEGVLERFGGVMDPGWRLAGSQAKGDAKPTRSETASVSMLEQLKTAYVAAMEDRDDAMGSHNSHAANYCQGRMDGYAKAWQMVCGYDTLHQEAVGGLLK
jgi:hypothetical protein